ncbi:MAG: hypothetical protein GX084_01915 [Acholeplasmataceae bacterium]|nr:hypothetical protein [Acidaminococcaceae bacterium]NLY83356.1 hypothetical protein [Acholeplasmataceae bacterium]
MAEEKKELTEEKRELDEREFLEVAAAIREKIRKSPELKADGKSAALEVLDAIARSVEAHGVRQHGLTKKKKQVALTVYERLSRDEENTREEKTVLEALVAITFQGIVQAK